MIDDPAPRNQGRFGNLLREALVVAVIGAMAAFLANQLSPRGLKLSRNYFPGGTAPLTAQPARAQNGTNSPLAARLQANGLRLAARARAEQLFQDPRRQHNLVLFVDARDEDDYQQGHIPGAYEFSPYHPEKYLAEVLPLCQFAEQIVVYCTGGDCEASETAALYLKDAGIPADKIWVYGGGITEWTNASFSVERGVRNSGEIQPPPG